MMLTDLVDDENVLDEAPTSDSEEQLPSIQRYAVSSYGADYPIDSLFTRLTSSDDAKESDIYIPDFQRGYVWSKTQADRFIESLLLGLPVPGIFLYRDEETGRLLVVDGSQRLRTIKYFMEGILDDSVYYLGDKVHKDFRGTSFKSLDAVDRRDFNNRIIHATIVKQEQPENDRTSIYYLFERLNTGGTPAQPQEVRRAIYGGILVRVLSELEKNAAWRQIYGPPSPRFKDQELILRFLALYFDGLKYGKTATTMKDFLTHFMARHRNVASNQTKFRKAFSSAIETVFQAVGRTAFRTTGALNAAIYDAVMVGVARRLERGAITSPSALKKAYGDLLNDDEFLNAIRTGTSQEQNVSTRLKKAITAFAQVQ